MGLRIDRLVIIALTTCAIYLFFLTTLGSIHIAILCTFAAMALIHFITRRLPTSPFDKRQNILARARTELEELSLSDPVQASVRIREVIMQTCPALPENSAIIPVIRHPGGRKFTADELVPLWRSSTGCSRVIIAVTASCDDSARALSTRLSAPSVTLTDAAQLMRMIAEAGPKPANLLNPPPRRRNVFSAIYRAASNAKSGKCILTGLMMLALFLYTGIPAYLIGTLLLLFIAGVSLRRRHFSFTE